MPFVGRKYEMLSLDIDASNPPLEILIVALLTQSDEVHTDIVWHKGPLYFFGRFNRAILNSKYETALATDILEISRFYAREIDTGLYGEYWRRRVEVDQWIVFCISKEITTQERLKSLDDVLLVQTYLVGNKLTLADIFVFSSLHEIDSVEFQKYSNLTRWFKFIQSFPAVQNALLLIKEHKVTVVNPRRCLPQQGKFADLPNAKPGKVVVRFPPEASGYLHIGHAKAALLNQYYAELYNGQFVMRFDDTNPAKETVEFEEAILQDLELLKIKPDRFTHTSDYFDKLEQYCTTLIKDRKAYVDDTPPELMKVKRDEKLKSANRDNPVEINLKLWEEMRRGSHIGQRCCVRAKIDYESKNGCLRDPTIYRCKFETHPRTGNKYKVYPTYDFACPLVDFIENVTHPLRTTEYEDRDDQYNWILQQFTNTLPCIVSYSRLNMTYTVLSKRKLTWFVDQGLVDGWDDPRMPTIRGILRHGMTVEALKDFIIAQGSSRSVVVMEWDKIWAFNKKVIDPVAVRYTALKHETVVKVNVIDAKKELLTVQNHPKDPTKGTKQVLVGPKLLIEREDAECLVVDQNVTFINWGNLMILKVNRDDNNTITSVDARLNLEDKNYKDTLKITWLTEPEDEKTNPILCYAVYFDHLLYAPTLFKEDDFKFFVNTSTRKEDLMLGEIELQRVKKGEIIQLQRKGFFICDVPYAPASSYSSREQPLILFHIPDGHATTAQKTQKLQKQVDEKKKIDKVKKLKNKEPEVLIQEQVTSIPKSKESDLNSKKLLSTLAQLSRDIKKQLIIVNDLRDRLEDEVRVLADQQYKYKQLIGCEWFDHVTEVKSKVVKIVEEIHKQSDKVQNLKSSKADKSVIDKEEKILWNLKKDYGDATGISYSHFELHQTPVGDKKTEINGNISKPVGATVASDTKTESKEEALKAEKIAEEIQKQGDKVRNLNNFKADKSIICKEVKIFLSLKSDYKDVTGQDWKPGQTTSGDKKTEIKGKTSKPVGATVASDTKTESKEEALKAEKIAEEIQKQGDKVRSLKSSKADKSIIDEEVKILFSLKSDYKDATGQDWKPGQTTSGDKKTEIMGKTSKPVGATVASDTKTESKEEALKAEKIAEEIQKQGDKVRSLKSSKADKSIIDEEVKILLNLKSDYKDATGQDWKPGQTTSGDKKTEIMGKTSKPVGATVASDTKTESKEEALKAEKVAEEIQKQGDKVRSLKSSKADKSIIDEEVKILLNLKSDYKDATGQDWKPGQTTSGDKKTEIMGKTSKPVGATVASDTKTESKEEALKTEKIAEEIQKQGDKVRSLKSSKADKSIIDEEVKILLNLKSDYKDATGQDWKPGQTAAVGVDKKTKIKEKTSKPAETTVSNNVSDSPKSDSSKKTRLGLEVKKEENFFEWYSQVITKTGMIEYYDVSGCYILRPWSFEIWKQIRKHIDQYLSVKNVQECCFPMFVTRDALEKEKTHIADFAPEVAWVTKCGNSEMAEPVAIRPTSETIMYPAYAKWLRSDTELPLKLNQWNNVVRWEFKDPKPFIRSREFLWQEGHSAFATKAEAELEVLSVLDMYAFVYEKMLCVPVVKGRKTEKEKFAGGEYTTTVEAFIPTSGRAIQGATSHHLGQNFSKMFNIQVEGIEGGNEKTFVYQNSWGLTTRTIGVMVMVHGDDKGLVLPPHVAPIQAIIIPCGITAKTTPEDKNKIYQACHEIFNIFQPKTENTYRVKCDFRDNRTVGWKYCDWELRGVPVRIEIGPKEIANDEVVFVRRDTFESQTIKGRNSVVSDLSLLFKSIEDNMYQRAKTKLDERTKLVENWDDFITEFNKKNLLLAPFCGEPQCEDNIKADSATMNATNDESGTLSMGAKGLCIPFKQPESATPLDELNCVHKLCEKKPKYFTLFGRSY